MKTYYIPTSTLNFNAILSTESISPRTFYGLREFGIKHWTPTDENNIDDVILLYEDAKSFSRDDSEQEDHPMLIAITTEETFPPYSNGICYSDHTIYIDPWHTRFIFFLEEHKRVALSMSDSVLDVKLLPLYNKQIVVQHFSDEYKKVNLTGNKGLSLKGKDAEINKDNNINKLKGMLYGYYIGAYLSFSPKVLKDLIAFKTVHNYLANCISNKENCNIQISDIEFYEQRIANSPANHKLLNTKDSEIVIQNGDIIALKAIKDKNIVELFNQWVKQVFFKPQYGKSIIPSRENILYDIIQITNTTADKQIAEQANKYLQDLQDYFDGICVKKMSFNDGLLSALSLVLLAGENWEKLLQVMQLNNLYDYRLAFAIYGCICGFADLYRTFTDYLLDCKDKDYVSDVYQEFYGQLFGKQIDTKTILSIPSKINAEPQEAIESGKQSTEVIDAKYKPIIDFLEAKSPELKERFVQRIAKIPNFSTPDEEYKFFLDLYDKLECKLWNKQLKKKEWKGVIEFLKPLNETRQKPKKEKLETQATKKIPKYSQSSLFPPRFYNDPEAFKHIEDLIPSADKKTIRDDIVWFQDDYNKERINDNNGKNKQGRYAENPTDNASVIENYKRFCLENRETLNPKLDWKKNIYRKVDIDAIIGRLKEIYK